jgi:hypothetical protein
MRHIIIHFAIVFCSLSFPIEANYAAETAPIGVILTKRIGNGAYGTSAYSFRLTSQDLAIHQNNVDLVFDGNGQIYINPTGGMNSRVLDLGTVPLEPSIACPSTNADWQSCCFTPCANHVYYQEVRDERQSFAVEFLVIETAPDMVKLRWKPVDPAHRVLPLAPGTGMAGTMGAAGGNDNNGANGAGASGR